METVIMSDLNKNELEAMRVLWEYGPQKPGEIQERFAWPIQNPTLRSVLRQLVEKQRAKRTKVGKAFVYRATSRRQATLKTMARRMADVFTGGSTAGLIAQLIESEKLSRDEIETLRRIAEDKSADD
jgi:predicted transcriptional regulator